MTFEEADRLLPRILRFLHHQGGYYKDMGNFVGNLQRNILLSLALEQFILYQEDGEIQGFISWWYIDEDHIPHVIMGQIPPDIKTGNVLYVVECGLSDKVSMWKVLRDVRRKMRKRLVWRNTRRSTTREFKGENRYGRQ